jgi:hypothetical protein
MLSITASRQDIYGRLAPSGFGHTICKSSLVTTSRSYTGRRIEGRHEADGQVEWRALIAKA